MAEFKIPDDPKIKRLLAIAAVALAGVGAYWYFMWKPDHVEVMAISAHADSLEEDNKLIKAAVQSGEIARIIAASDQYTAQLKVLRRLVPTSTEVPALIDGVSTAARQSGMDLGNYTPGAEMPGDFFDAKKFSFSVTGPYHRVAEFLTAIGSLDQILVPMNINIKPSARRIDRRPAKDEIFVDVDFEVMTYVSKTTLAAVTR
jgi:type IV pilus assembly protein PilO